MKTNEMKKGQRIRLRNGWEAEIADNMKGNTRMAMVFGEYKELGSVYSHDIVQYFDETWQKTNHTKAQLELKKLVDEVRG